MRVSPLIVAVFSFVLASAVSAREALNLSRYRLVFELPPPLIADGHAIDLPEFEERCRDDDGCEITLVITGDTYAAVQSRIFFNANGTAWVGQDGRIGHSADGLVEVMMALDTGPVNCRVDESDLTTGYDDDVDALTLRLGFPPVGGNVRCIMTVID